MPRKGETYYRRATPSRARLATLESYDRTNKVWNVVTDDGETIIDGAFVSNDTLRRRWIKVKGPRNGF